MWTKESSPHVNGLISACAVTSLQDTAVATSNGTKLRGYAQTIASHHATPASDEDERPIDRYDYDDEKDEGPSLESDVELERGRGRGRRGGGRRRGRGRGRGRRRRRGRGSFRRGRRRFRGSRRFRRGRSFRRGRRFSRRRGGFRGSGRCIDRCLARTNRSLRSCENRCGFFSSESIVDLFYATGGFSEAPTDEDLTLYLSAAPSEDQRMNDLSDDNGEADDYDDYNDYDDSDGEPDFLEAAVSLGESPDGYYYDEPDDKALN